MTINYYDPNNGILAERLDLAWQDYNNQENSHKDRELALLFLLDVLHINYTEKESDSINVILTERMALRKLHKAQNPNFIPTISPEQLFSVEPSKLQAIIEKLSSQEGHLLLNESRSAVDADNYFTDEELEIAQRLIARQEILALSSVQYHSDKSYASYYSPEKREQKRILVKNGLFHSGTEPFDGTKGISHKKPGFYAFTFNLNGDISVFNHKEGKDSATNEYLVHSSMNAGNPVICAGELQINEQGKLIGITMHSGHYRPTLFNTYRFLLYLESQGMDVSDVNIYLDDPKEKVLYIGEEPDQSSDNEQVMGTKPEHVLIDTFKSNNENSADVAQKETRYIKASVLTGNISKVINDCISEIAQYRNHRKNGLSSFFSKLCLNSSLTTMRMQYAAQIIDQFQNLSQSFYCSNNKQEQIAELMTKIENFKNKNDLLSKKFGKKTDSGMFDQKIKAVYEKLKKLKEETRTAEQEEEAQSEFKKLH